MKIYLTKMFYELITSPRIRWMLFTLFFGSMPIFMRWLAATAGDDPVPSFVLSDFIFLGLMFNAAAMTNVCTQKFKPDVYLIITAIAAGTSAVLVGLFMMDAINQVSNIIWYVTFGVLIFVFVMSFSTTGTRTLEYIQKKVDFANDLVELSPEMIDSVIEGMCDSTKSREERDILQKIVTEVAARLKQERKQAITNQQSD